MNEIDQQIIKHNTITPTERCGIINNTICKTSDYCVNMVVDISKLKKILYLLSMIIWKLNLIFYIIIKINFFFTDNEKTFYQFCSYTHTNINKNYFNISSSGILSIIKRFCFNDFCGTLNGTYNGTYNRTYNGTFNGVFNGANFVTNNYLSIIIILVLIKLGCL